MEIMKFEQVYKNFIDNGETIQALKETSFTLHAGELVAIIGPSGSGKSTLLTMMGGLQRPTGGKITFKGQALDTMDEDKRNILRFDEIGFILQASNLVPYLTIEEQFQLVDKFEKRKYDKAKSEELMKKMDILKRRNQYPSDLSGGERQRAAICRALYTNPSLLLADEPTASLDSKKAMDVIKLMQEITRNSNRTTVLVTHDDRLLDYCDRVFKIVDGILTQER
ncbi:ABC transporter ATP-binding protein [Erysipelotrichaceae bacterium OH741_COT-311]|nr:ABC transporter ATP-binding protein [Erysipelotrichaceae bacterium OH741_COT-311]